MFNKTNPYVLLLLLRDAIAQTTGLGPYGCRPDSGVSLLPACDRLNSTLYSCFPSVQHTTTSIIQNCFCKQNALNDIIDCESQFRLCYLNDQADTQAQSVLSNWHGWCDTYVTFTPTTPVLSNPSTTVPTGGGTQAPYCSNVLTSCAALSSQERDCLDLDPSATAASFMSCACKLSLLSLASVCLVDVPVTCSSRSAAVTDVGLFSICKATYSNNQLITTNAAGDRTTSTILTASSRSAITTIVPSTTTTSISSTSSSSTASGTTTSQITSSTSTKPSSAASSTTAAGIATKSSTTRSYYQAWTGVMAATAFVFVVGLVLL